jgi:hypothetical protein
MYPCQRILTQPWITRQNTTRLASCATAQPFEQNPSVSKVQKRYECLNISQDSVK